MRVLYSSFSSATHQLFFPPRLQIVASEQNADRSPAHARRQLPLHGFLGDEPHAPSRLALRRRAAHHGDDALALAGIQKPLPARLLLLIQRRAIARTVFGATPTLPAACTAVCPWSSWRRIKARLSTRADSRPLFSIPAICFRSFLLRWTFTRW